MGLIDIKTPYGTTVHSFQELHQNFRPVKILELILDPSRPLRVLLPLINHLEIGFDFFEDGDVDLGGHFQFYRHGTPMRSG